jgi:hypothetical protein
MGRTESAGLAWPLACNDLPVPRDDPQLSAETPNHPLGLDQQAPTAVSGVDDAASNVNVGAGMTGLNVRNGQVTFTTSTILASRPGQDLAARNAT